MHQTGRLAGILHVLIAYDVSLAMSHTKDMGFADCSLRKDQLGAKHGQVDLLSELERARIVLSSDGQTRLRFIKCIKDANNIAEPIVRAIVTTMRHSHRARHKHKGPRIKPLQVLLLSDPKRATIRSKAAGQSASCQPIYQTRRAQAW